MTQGIYRIEIAGQMYIGSSLRIEKRFSAHKSNLRYGRHGNARMQKLYDDGHHITYEVLLECEEEDLLILEQASLERYEPSLNEEFTAKRPTPQDRAKRAATFAGIKKSSETRARISATLTGTKRSPETIAKMSAAATGRMASPEARAKLRAFRTGRKASPETCAKMSAAKKGKKRSPEARANMRAAWVERKNRESDRIRPNDSGDPV